MSASAIVNDGQITNLGRTQESEKAKKKTGSDSVDKEQFLNLLVTQLKYQDPTSPMDNTEYVSQLATFSELEQMQNVAKSSEVNRATSMVGSLVTVEYLNETTGVTTEITGKVDYVSVSGSKVKVSVNDQLYDLSDVKKVYDTDYADAVALAEEFAASYGKLPGYNNLTANNVSSYEDRMRSLYSTFSEMSIYQKSFLSADIQAGMEAYVNRFKDFGIDVTTKKSDSSSSSSSNTTTDTSNNTSNSTTQQETNATGTTTTPAAGSTDDTSTQPATDAADPTDTTAAAEALTGATGTDGDTAGSSTTDTAEEPAETTPAEGTAEA